MDPPLVGFFADKRSKSWARIAEVGAFCVNILSRDQDELCRNFAASKPDKFADMPHWLTPNGAPVLDAVVAWCECSLEAVYEAGDHDIALGRVTRMAIDRGVSPLLFHRGELLTVAAA